MTPSADRAQGAARAPSPAASRLRADETFAGDPPQGRLYIGGLGWFAVRQRGQQVRLDGLSHQARQRRRFAERVADRLAYPEIDVRLRGHDLESASTEFVPVAASPLGQRVIRDAEAVTEKVMRIPGETRVYTDGMTAVVLVHGPDWSLVCEYSSADVVIRVCGDELGEVALALDEDPDPQAQAQLLTMTFDVLLQLQRLSVDGDMFDTQLR